MIKPLVTSILLALVTACTLQGNADSTSPSNPEVTASKSQTPQNLISSPTSASGATTIPPTLVPSPPRTPSRLPVPTISAMWTHDKGGAISFSSEDPTGHVQVYAVRDDGSGLAQLTRNDQDNIVIAWSPDGNWISFESSRSTDQFGNEIWIVKPDGSGLSNISRSPATDNAPSWSPDSQHLAFVSDRDGVDQIYVLELGSTQVQNLSRGNYNALDPQWSPDGEQISFVSDRSGAYELYVMNADGSGVVPLTNDQKGIQHAIWSPSGDQIAFTVNDELWVMKSDSTDQRKLSGALFAALPEWSPDGLTLAFQGLDINDIRAQHFDIYMAEVSDGTVTKITDGSREYALGSWAPDNIGLIVLAGESVGNMGMYIVRRDGSELRPFGMKLDQRIVSAKWQP